MKPNDDPVILIHFEDGHVEPHDTREVVSRIARDLQPSELRLQPWVIEMAAECLVRHFQEIARHRIVSLAEFIGTTRELLESFVMEVGQGNVHDRQLDLLATVRHPGCGFELEFFSRLRNFLAEIGKGSARSASAGSSSAKLQEASPNAGLPSGVPLIRITGLCDCVRFLTGQRHWSRRCGELRDEIVAFIRRETARMGRNSPVVAIIS